MKKITFLAGAALGAIVGTAAGVLLTPKTEEKVRCEVKKITKLLTERALKEVEKKTGLTRAQYEKIVDSVLAGYAKNSKLAKKTIDALSKDLKNRWDEIQKELKKIRGK